MTSARLYIAATISLCLWRPGGAMLRADEPTTRAASALSAAETEACQAVVKQLGAGGRCEAGESFVLVTQTSAEKTARLLQLAEATREAIRRELSILGVPMDDTPGRMMIVYMEKWRDFEAIAKISEFRPVQGVPGYYDEPRRRCLVFDIESLDAVSRQRAAIDKAKARHAELEAEGKPALVLKKEIDASEKSLARTVDALTSLVIQHEIAHQVLAEMGVVDARAPRWLREGMAIRYEGQGTPAMRKADFWAADSRVGRFDENLLRRVLSDDDFLSPDRADAAYRYAIAWGIVDYIMVHRAPELIAYLAQVRTGEARTGEAAVKAFEKAFGPVDERLIAAIREHVQNMP